MRFDEKQLKQVTEAILGPDGNALMQFMRARQQGQPIRPAEVPKLAIDLGWVDHKGSLTPIGYKASDPIREYLFWTERGRRHHASLELEVLHDDNFRGKRILEIGSGVGCNLLSLQQVAQSVVGIEIEPLYVQFTPIFAKLEGLPIPRIHVGMAEELPLDDASIDIVLACGAVQFMDFSRTFAEVRRVLVDTGLFLNSMSHLSGYVYLSTIKRGWSFLRPKTFLRQSAIILAMLCYPVAGRTFLRPQDPMHPTFRRMRKLLAEHGLDLELERTGEVNHEYTYVAQKDVGFNIENNADRDHGKLFHHGNS